MRQADVLNYRNDGGSQARSLEEESLGLDVLPHSDCFSLSVVLEMLSKPSIFHDSGSEVIKGQTIEVSCQSINGTSPISYQLLKGSDLLASQNVSSNEPAVFKDNPTKDVEYQCIADNCHSHAGMPSKVLRVKVIGKSLACGKNSCRTGALVRMFKGLEWTREAGGTYAKSVNMTRGHAGPWPKYMRPVIGVVSVVIFRTFQVSC